MRQKAIHIQAFSAQELKTTLQACGIVKLDAAAQIEALNYVNNLIYRAGAHNPAPVILKGEN